MTDSRVPAHMTEQQAEQAAERLQAASNNQWGEFWKGVTGIPTAMQEHDQSVHLKEAIVDQHAITFVTNTAGAAGNAVASGYHSAHTAMDARARAQAAEEQRLSSENPEISNLFGGMGGALSAAIHMPGNLYNAAQKRERDFAASRPETAKLAAIPFLTGAVEDYALMVGGQGHPAEARVAQARPAVAPAPEVAARPAAAPAAPPARPAHAEVAALPAKPHPHHHAEALAQADTNPGHPGHAGQRSVEIAAGDGYWRASRKLLGDDASNREVLAMVAKLERANHGETTLRKGEVIHFV